MENKHTDRTIPCTASIPEGTFAYRGECPTCLYSSYNRDDGWYCSWYSRWVDPQDRSGCLSWEDRDP